MYIPERLIASNNRYYLKSNIDCLCKYSELFSMYTLIARFIRPTWSPSGAGRALVGPMLAPWTLLSGHISGGLCHRRYPSYTYEISFARNVRFSCQLVLQLYTEHGSDIVVIYAKFQYDWVTEKWFICIRYFTRFWFKMSFRRISHSAQSPSVF